jgi:hypothetical protein
MNLRLAANSMTKKRNRVTWIFTGVPNTISEHGHGTEIDGGMVGTIIIIFDGMVGSIIIVFKSAESHRSND